MELEIINKNSFVRNTKKFKKILDLSWMGLVITNPWLLRKEEGFYLQLTLADL